MALIFWLIVAGLLWAIVAEIFIVMVKKLGKIELKGSRLSLMFYRWILFALGGLDVAILVALERWLT